MVIIPNAKLLSFVFLVVMLRRVWNIRSVRLVDFTMMEKDTMRRVLIHPETFIYMVPWACDSEFKCRWLQNHRSSRITSSFISQCLKQARKRNCCPPAMSHIRVIIEIDNLNMLVVFRFSDIHCFIYLAFLFCMQNRGNINA